MRKRVNNMNNHNPNTQSIDNNVFDNMSVEECKNSLKEMIDCIENTKSLKAIFRITVKHYLHG